MSWLPWHKMDPNERIAAPVLVRELGVMKAIAIGRALRAAQKRGEPFAELGAPADEKERMSREQIAGAVLLYRELLKRVDRARALEVTEKVVITAGVEFLRQVLGPLKREQIEPLGPEERERFARERGERFFNADMRWDEVSPEQVRFTVTHCRFPGLCKAAGAPELAGMFCRVDSAFFGDPANGATLHRTRTIAGGDRECPFTIALAGAVAKGR